MTRQLTITAAEWASVTDGTLWLVRERTDEWTWLPPAEFVQACAPCARCQDTRTIHRTTFPTPCPYCHIELVGPCPTCAVRHRWCGLDGKPRCDTYGLVTLGCGHAVGEPMPIYGDDGDDGATGEHLYASAILGAVYLHAGLHLHTGLDITDRLAHAGPPESLVGKLALKLEVGGIVTRGAAVSERLTDKDVDYWTNDRWVHPLDGSRTMVPSHTALLAREVQASRKLIADLRALHRPMWVSDAAEAAGKEPWVCELCGTGDGSWPCESVLLIDEAGL